jgi:hypothetical protein
MNNPLDEGAAPAWQSTAENLHRYFHDAADAKCLLWVNPAQFDPFDRVPLVEEHRVRVPINHPRFDMRLGPYLVPLDLSKREDAGVFSDSVEMAWLAWTAESLSAFCGQPIAGWVGTQAPAQALANHWAWSCHLHRRQGLSKLLRFHDPGVREWLWPTLTEQQRQSLLGPADSLLAIGRGHTLLRHVLTSVPDPADATPSFVLNDQQWAQVDEYATIHAAWVAWSAEQICAAAPVHDVLKALSDATRYGVRDAQDRELFALHALQLGGGFHAHEKMRPVWARTLAGDYYGSALEEVFAHPADRLHSHLKRTRLSAPGKSHG